MRQLACNRSANILLLHRCLPCHGISSLPEIEGDKSSQEGLQAYSIGYFHIDIAEVQTAEGKLFLFVVIDRTGKFAFVQLVESATRVTASAFLVALVAAVPHSIRTMLTDNGIQFRLPARYADEPTARYLTHMFDLRFVEHGIEHRFTRINHPWTNGQVERMNRSIKDATRSASTTTSTSNSGDTSRRLSPPTVSAAGSSASAASHPTHSSAKHGPSSLNASP